MNERRVIAVAMVVISCSTLLVFGNPAPPRNKAEMVEAIVKLQQEVQYLTTRVSDLEAAMRAKHPRPPNTPSHGLTIKRVPGEDYWQRASGHEFVTFSIKVKNDTNRTISDFCEVITYDADGDIISVLTRDSGDALAVNLAPGQYFVLRPYMKQIEYKRMKTFEFRLRNP